MTFVLPMTCFQGHVNEICFRNISMPVTSELGIFAADMNMDSGHEHGYEHGYEHG